MSVAILSAVAALVFLVGDALVIPFVMRPLFASALGATMLDTLRLAPAALFYIIHIAGLVWFAGVPSLQARKPSLALINGAALGLVAYSCYEMTSWTIMRDWHAGLVITDIAWGATISGVAVWVGAMAALRGSVRSRRTG